MTVDNQRQLIELADHVFRIIDAVRTIQIKIEEIHIKFKGVTIGGQKAEDFNA